MIVYFCFFFGFAWLLDRERRRAVTSSSRRSAIRPEYGATFRYYLYLEWKAHPYWGLSQFITLSAATQLHDSE